MSRKPSGSPEAVQRALEITKSTESASDIRLALSVVLPVIHGMSLKDTAALIGRSEVWVAKERRKFIQEQPRKPEGGKRGGRRNQLIPANEEDPFMELVCERYIRIHAQWRSIDVCSNALREKVNLSFVELVHAEIEERIQRRTTRTTVYNLLARTGKRQFPVYEPSMWEIKCNHEISKRCGRIFRLPELLRTPEHILPIINNI